MFDFTLSFSHPHLAWKHQKTNTILHCIFGNTREKSTLTSDSSDEVVSNS